jgi:hypothetical protein
MSICRTCAVGCATSDCKNHLGEPHDPRLPADSHDIAILVHMYHEITQPYGLLYNLVPALKPGARVGINATSNATKFAPA